MIIQFHVRNFGSIKETQTLSFEADKSNHLEDHFVIQTKSGHRLLKIALIFGANASGKSTVLRALDFLRDMVLSPALKKTEELNFEPFLFDPKTPAQSSMLSIEFIQNDVKYLYEVEFTKQAIVKEDLHFFDPNKAKVYTRTTDLNNQFSEITFGSKIKTDKAFEKTLESNTLWNNTVLGGFLKTNIESKQLSDVIAWFQEYLRPLINSNSNLQNLIVNDIESSKIQKRDLLKILQKADFNISDFSLSEPIQMTDGIKKVFKALDFSDDLIEKLSNNSPKKITIEHTIDAHKYSLPFNYESEGTKRYFEFAGLLSRLITTSIAIPIDELEASLHPDLYQHFVLSFIMNSTSSQLLVTTHNREILDNKDIYRNDSIWFTDKRRSCATELYSLADFDSSVIRDSTNVLNAYKSGKLNAVPNLEDYYLEFGK
ncbi:MAG TPA: ATP-binding protein [Cyclobacteriaceae bacterium]|nr:ATP-binding protein [Cyclobacteriaceae bacterium]